MLLGQHEVYWRGLCVGCSKIWFLQRDCCQVPSLPYHPLMGSSNRAWQSTQPLHHQVQCVLVDEMGDWSFDAAVQALLTLRSCAPTMEASTTCTVRPEGGVWSR